MSQCQFDIVAVVVMVTVDDAVVAVSAQCQPGLPPQQ